MNNPIINWAKLALILCCIPFHSSCIYVPPVWDVSDAVYRVDSITPGTTTKKEVIAELGDPDTQDPYSRADRYIYNGYNSGGTFGIFIINGEIPINQEQWKVIVSFDESDVVSSVYTLENDLPFLYPTKFSNTKKTRYDKEWIITNEADIYCPNADLGQADAQFHVGELLYNGVTNKKDNVRAWVWYSLSSTNGDMRADEKLVRVTAELSPELLTQAKQQLKSWKPGQCVYDLTPSNN